NDRAKRFSRYRICRTRSRIFFREWAPLQGEEFRVPPATAGNGRGGGERAGGRAPSCGRSGHGRGQIAGLSHPGNSVCARATKKSNHLDPPNETSGTASLQGYPDLKEDFAGGVRSCAHERAPKLSLSSAIGTRAST